MLARIREGNTVFIKIITGEEKVYPVADIRNSADRDRVTHVCLDLRICSICRHSQEQGGESDSKDQYNRRDAGKPGAARQNISHTRLIIRPKTKRFREKVQKSQAGSRRGSAFTSGIVKNRFWFL